jgi:hypothetical protein
VGVVSSDRLGLESSKFQHHQFEHLLNNDDSDNIFCTTRAQLQSMNELHSSSIVHVDKSIGWNFWAAREELARLSASQCKVGSTQSRMRLSDDTPRHAGIQIGGIGSMDLYLMRDHTGERRKNLHESE